MIPRNYVGPLPTPAFPQQVSAVVFPPLMGWMSGEISATKGQQPLGIARYVGKIVAVNMSIGNAGKDDASANSPRVSGEVYINGTSCLTTRPSIGYLSGELAGAQKSTYVDADDACVQRAVINTSANTLAVGDVITWSLTYGGASSPTVKAQNPCIIVEVVPT
jgi:hypothetical protein